MSRDGIRLSGHVEVRAYEADYAQSIRIGVFRRVNGKRRILILKGAEWVEYEPGTETPATFTLDGYEEKEAIVQQLGDLAMRFGFKPTTQRIEGYSDAQSAHLADVRIMRDRLLSIVERNT